MFRPNLTGEMLERFGRRGIGLSFRFVLGDLEIVFRPQLIPIRGRDNPGALHVLQYLHECLTPLSTLAVQLGTGLVHLQGFAVEGRAVESDDCLFRFGIGFHLNESEASGETSPVISHDLEPLNSAVLLKYGSNVLSGHARTEISNKNVVHNAFLSSGRSALVWQQGPKHSFPLKLLIGAGGKEIGGTVPCLPTL